MRKGQLAAIFVNIAYAIAAWVCVFVCWIRKQTKVKKNHTIAREKHKTKVKQVLCQLNAVAIVPDVDLSVVWILSRVTMIKIGNGSTSHDMTFKSSTQHRHRDGNLRTRTIILVGVCSPSVVNGKRLSDAGETLIWSNDFFRNEHYSRCFIMNWQHLAQFNLYCTRVLRNKQQKPKSNLIN